MIFAGRIIKIISPSYAARGEIMSRREDARSLDAFLDAMWKERYPFLPSSRGKWPLNREQILSEVVPMTKRAAR